MKLFIDTSEVEKVEEYQRMGFVEGCTTNPKIMAKDGVKDWESRLEELSEIMEGPVSGEVTTNDEDEMVEQARKISEIGENVNVKIPANRPGFRAVSRLEDIQINMTACMSPGQVFLAEKAGAEYASIFMGRVSDMGYDPCTVIQEASELCEDTKIIVGSIRKVHDIQEAFLSGADIVTARPEFIDEIIENRKTDEMVREFIESS
jgi:transaldolase